MKKIAFILLPLQVCPGESSISTLLVNLIKENEKKNQLNMTIFSNYHKTAKKESEAFKHTKFKYLKLTVLDKIFIFMYRILKKLFNIKVSWFDRFYYKCYKICKKENFDQIIVEAGAYDSYEIYAKNIGRDKMILHLHEDDYRKRHERIFSKVICVSEFLKKWMKDMSGDNLTCEVLKNAIPLDNFKAPISLEEKEKIRNKLNITKEDFVVLFCGRLFEDKGILELIRSLKRLPEEIKLVIIGNFNNEKDTAFMHQFNQAIQEVEAKVRMLGYVNYQEIRPYYAIANLQVVPSKWEEPAGLVTIEGMASGLPLIVTKSGGMVEYIDEECALIVDKKNLEENLSKAILHLYRDEETCQKMSKHGKQRAEMFSSQRYYEDFVKLVDRWE